MVQKGAPPAGDVISPETAMLMAEAAARGAHGASPGKNKKASVWKYFNVLPNEYAECKICLKPLRVKGQTTSTMRAHAVKVHGLKL